MQLDSFYPVIGTQNLQASRDFYVGLLGFGLTFEADWYISLKHPRGHELALLDYTHESVPVDYRKPLTGLLLLNFEVPDVDAEYARLIQEVGLPLLLELRSEAFGQRHFITVDPNGILIDVITLIPPTGEYLDQYQS